jgi:YggT family protein
VFTQIGVFLVDAVVSFFVFMLLARFHFQWLRVPFRNPVGEFVLATTSWMVVPARRVVPGLAGLDLPTLLLAFVLQALGLWAQAAIVGAEPGALTIAIIALVDLLRYSLYILVFAVIVQAVLSWVNPYTPLAPALDALVRPFLRPLRRFVPPVGNVDLTPLILIVILYVLLIVVNHLAPRIAAITL